MSQNPADPYLEYLQRFDREVGPLPVDGYGKWNGRLVRKLGPEAFTAKYGEYAQIDQHYRKMFERGDTFSDTLVKARKERQAELLLDDE